MVQVEDDDAPRPPDAKVARPGWEHAKVLLLWQYPGEFDTLEVMAEDRMLPISTIAREQFLELIAGQ